MNLWLRGLPGVRTGLAPYDQYPYVPAKSPQLSRNCPQRLSYLAICGASRLLLS
jgi:hypothetical protein